MVQTILKTLEVDPLRGIDQPSGRPHLPYKTLTAALVAAQGNATIKLAPGTYSTASGERFPLRLDHRVVVMGQESSQGEGVVIAGGGFVPGDSHLSAALILEDQAQVRGVTIQNPEGIGVLVRSGVPLVRACRMNQCRQAGIQVTGTSNPLILHVRGDQMAGVGLILMDQAKGEIRECVLQQCNVGLHILGAAAPLLMDNQCAHNQTGIRVAGTASPVLRRNRFVQNHQWGLLVQERSQPDLGQPADEAHNILRDNGQGDLRNDTGLPLMSVGNDLLPQALVGPITLTPSQVPDPAAVPPILLQSIEPEPTAPAPPNLPTAPAPPPVVSRFVDLSGHWAVAYIEALADRNLVKGFADGTYRPDDTITRAQFAALVASSYGRRTWVHQPSAFLDVPPTFWAYQAIDIAHRQGFVTGYPDQTYRPSQPMTRVQAIVAVANGLGLPPAPASTLGRYADRTHIPSYAITPLSAATQAGLVLNHPQADQVRPQDAMTRAEVAVLIYQGLVALGQAPRMAEATPSPQPSVAQGSFADTRDHWAKDFIQGLLNLDVLRGQSDGQFYPDQAMTRSQFAALLVAAFQPAPHLERQPFADVPAHHWAANAITTACRGGFLTGFPDGTFAPDHAVLRVQVWLALVNGLSLAQDQLVQMDVLNRYQDRNTLPSYTLTAVALATQLGLVVNRPNLTQLNPHRAATRADIAAAVYQTLVYQRRLPPIQNPYIVRV